MSVHRSAEARDYVKRIIAEELAEARTVGMIIRNGEADLRCRHVMLVCGMVARWKELPPSRVRVVTRSGWDSELNLDAEPFVPQGKTRVDEFGNDLSVPMWRPGNGTGRGQPEDYPSEAPQSAEDSRGRVPSESFSVADPEPAELRLGY